MTKTATTTKTPLTIITIETRNPEWLICKADVAAAEKAARNARSRPADMAESNAAHTREVTENERHGSGPLITNGQAHQRGSGSGCEVVYSARCRCADIGTPCDCDAYTRPFTDAEIDAAVKSAKDAERDAEKARKALADAPPTFNASAAAGSRYVWWPQDVIVDPRYRRYRGQPLTDDDLETLGVHNLNSAIQNGSVLQVSP